MWSSLLLAGLLGGWWGVLALAPTEPHAATSGRTASPSTSYAEDYYYYDNTMIFGYPSATRQDRAYNNDPEGDVAGKENEDREFVRSTLQMEARIGGRSRLRYRRQMEMLQLASEKSGKPIRRDWEELESASDVKKLEDEALGSTNHVVREMLRDPIVSRERQAATNDEPSDAFAPTAGGYYANGTSRSSELTAIGDPRRNVDDGPTMERPRIIRSPKQRARNRTRTDSPREQRRRCQNRNCRGRNWCPDMDVGNRAFLAPTVFEGKARSMSSLRKPGSNYAVTFEVRQVYKSQPGFLPLQKNDSVRLHFRDKTAPGKSTLCGHDVSKDAGGAIGTSTGSGQHSHQQKERDGISAGIVRANIKRGKVYLVFVNRVGPRNFTILGEPVIRSKKNEQAVQAVIRPDYVREVTLSELRDSVARYRDRVKLVCRTRGSPPPRVHWLKDGVPLQPRRGLRIQHKRRRSKVVISSARPEDSGRYECVAESTSGHRASLAAQLLVAHDTRIPETTTAAWLRQEQPCPIAGDFCMNGGTCLFFETVGEPACRCAEGFTGLRCETKDVISTGSVYNRHRAPFSCKLGLSTSYYC